jgi:hypothetical protein
MRWAVYVARMAEKRTAYRFLVEKLEGKTARKVRRMWVHDIKMDLG